MSHFNCLQRRDSSLILRSNFLYLKIMTLFNYTLNNDLVFYSMFAGTVGLIGYKFISTYVNSFYVDKGVQTEAWEDYSNRPSLIGPESVTSLDTVTPISQYVSPTSEVGIQTISDRVSTATTVLPIPPINIEMTPNSDIVRGATSLTIEISPTELNPNLIKEMELLNSSADLAIIEAYIPIPELMDAANSVTQFYPWFM